MTLHDITSHYITLHYITVCYLREVDRVQHAARSRARGARRGVVVEAGRGGRGLGGGAAVWLVSLV